MSFDYIYVLKFQRFLFFGKNDNVEENERNIFTLNLYASMIKIEGIKIYNNAKPVSVVCLFSKLNTNLQKKFSTHKITNYTFHSVYRIQLKFLVYNSVTDNK